MQIIKKKTKLLLKLLTNIENFLSCPFEAAF